MQNYSVDKNKVFVMALLFLYIRGTLALNNKKKVGNLH